MTLRCGILTLKTSDSFFRSFRFLRQNEAFSATEQNQTYKNSLFFRNLNAIQLRTTFFSGVCRIPPLSHRLNNWFYLESTNRRTKILYELECDVRANKNADQAFSMQRLSSHSISYNIFVLRLFPLINQYMKSLFYRCNWKKVHVILK